MEKGGFGANAPFFHNNYQYMIFQRRQKALLWSKWLSHSLTT